MTPGRYRLTRDVPNPAPDRRFRSDWTKREVWPAGTEVHVVYARGGLEMFDGGPRRNYFTPNHPGWRALAPHLEPFND